MRYNQNTKEEYITPEMRIRDFRLECGLCLSPDTGYTNESFTEDPELVW